LSTKENRKDLIISSLRFFYFPFAKPLPNILKKPLFIPFFSVRKSTDN
jgi:hypothetical protein